MTKSMTLAVLGATKGIGAATVRHGLANGHTIRAVSRQAAEHFEPSDQLTAYSADATDSDAMMPAIDGADAVIYAIGVDHTPAMLWQPVTLFSASTRAVLTAMSAVGVRRLLVVTGFGAGRSRSAMSKLERAGHWAVLGRPYADKDRQEAMIEDSDTDWTIVRPVILTNGRGEGRYRVLDTPADWSNGLISRSDVGHYLVSAAEAERNVKQSVVLRR